MRAAIKKFCFEYIREDSDRVAEMTAILHKIEGDACLHFLVDILLIAPYSVQKSILEYNSSIDRDFILREIGELVPTKIAEEKEAAQRVKEIIRKED